MTPRAPFRLDPSLTFYFYIDSVPFTRATLEGKTSLGGSESAAISVARALAAQGHQVTVYTSKLELGQDDPSNYFGVEWQSAQVLNDSLQVAPPDVFIALRSPAPFQLHVPAKLSLLWNQDMLTDLTQVAGALSQIDCMVYVSRYQEQQWREKAPKVFGRTTAYIINNPIDFELVPLWPEETAPIHGLCQYCDQAKDQHSHALVGGESVATGQDQQPGACPQHVEAMHYSRPRTRFAHISRPERGLDPLLQMWPAIKARIPDAELVICRYASMYDGEGTQVKAMVEAFDAKVAEAQEQTGGITYAGTLSKRDLYELLTNSSFLLYPGIATFAETSCIALIEAQACGCIPLASYRGALPETLGAGAGVLLTGDAYTPEYQQTYVDTLVGLVGMDSQVLYNMRVAGRAHVYPGYSAGVVAANLVDYIKGQFISRYEANKPRVMKQLMQWDHHAAAALVAQDIWDQHPPETTNGHPDTWPPECRESALARAFCDRVIAGDDQGADHYAENSLDTEQEANFTLNGRFLAVLERLKPHVDPDRDMVLTDLAAGNGSFALMVLRAFPRVTVQLIDYSNGQLDKAITALARNGFEGRFEVFQADLHAMPKREAITSGAVGDAGTVCPVEADLVFCGEYLEHTVHPHLVIEWLETFAKPAGVVCLTTPHGPLTELMPYHKEVHRGHTHHFELRDIMRLAGRKKDFHVNHLGTGETARGNVTGFWLVSWTTGGHIKDLSAVAKPCDYGHTILTTRPLERLVAMMIVRDGEDWLQKCLSSIWPLVDHIVIGDTGSQDHTREIARRFPHTTILDIGWDVEQGFAHARNQVLDYAKTQQQADWVLWLDADEHLVGGLDIRRHCRARSPWLGYVIPQHHLLLDMDKFYDVPVRLFRTDSTLRFYGIIHEQPETEVNKGVFPSIDLPAHIAIVHYGYEDELTRKHKLLGRNMPMLVKELKSNQVREMSYVLYMRDLVTVSGYEGAPEVVKPSTQTRLRNVIALYRDKGFSDPAHRLHKLAWPSYQLALKWLKLGFEVEWSFGAGLPRLKGGVRGERFLVLEQAEADAICQHRLAAWMDQLKPATYDTRVYDGARAAEVTVPDIPVHAGPTRDLHTGATPGQSAEAAVAEAAPLMSAKE